MFDMAKVGALVGSFAVLSTIRSLLLTTDAERALFTVAVAGHWQICLGAGAFFKHHAGDLFVTFNDYGLGIRRA